MRLLCIITMAAGLGAHIVAASCLPSHENKPGLHRAMIAHGKKWFGTATDNGTNIQDPKQLPIIHNKREFGVITPANALKWLYTEKVRGEFTWELADTLVNMVVDNKQQLHCHTLVWPLHIPDWVEHGNFDNETLIDIMVSHIETTAGRYKGKCYKWDVVNEALNKDGTHRDSVFYRTIGEAYIPIAFRAAAKADPKAQLWYNDFDLEFGGAKLEGAKNIVKLLRSYGIRIDGVGLQAHMSSEPTPAQPDITPSEETLVKSLRGLTSLDVDVAYSELDMRVNVNETVTQEKLRVQAKAYGRIVSSCMAVKRCVGIIVWGISDKYSWIPDFFPGEGAASIWDVNWGKKPAYKAVLDAINA